MNTYVLPELVTEEEIDSLIQLAEDIEHDILTDRLDGGKFHILRHRGMFDGAERVA